MTGLRLYTLFLFIISGFIISSCGVTRPGPSIYEAPEDDEIVFEEGAIIQEGLASWYGPDFQGRPTANGETYNMEDLTAAHRTLPFNTMVRVKNQDNGKSVDVRINDRGPYVGERIIDLSRKAAREIDMIHDGIGEVRIQLLKVGDRQITSLNSSSRESFTVQLASFETEHRAKEESEKIDGSEVVAVPIDGKMIYRVYFGNYSNPEDAEQAKRQLRRSGLAGFVKQREN